jgi:hypothetical protein
MNQPMGSCYNYQEKASSLSDELEHHKRRKHPRITETPIVSHASLPTQIQDDDTAYTNNTAMEPEEPGDMDVEEQNNPKGHFVEKFQGAGAIFGAGETFMDQFNRDRFAQERAENVYYAFASRSEWELASFLARSSLSMAAIDKFLSLTLVRPAGCLHSTEQ